MKKTTLLFLLMISAICYGQNQLLSSIEEIDIGGGNWINSSGINYEYENGNLKSETDFFWNGLNWEASGKITYTYNGSNKVTVEVYQSYNSSTGMYDNDERIVYTYNGNGDLSLIESYDWDTGAWVAESRSTIFYSGTTLTGGISEDYDGSVWTNTFQSSVSYNGNGTIDEIIEEEWNGTTWVLEGRDSFTYDGNNRIATVKFDIRNGMAWEEVFTTTYVVDGNGNRISETDAFAGGGGGDETITYAYDMTALMSSFDNPFADYNGFVYLYEDFPFFNKILTENSSNNYRTTYDYNNVLSLNNLKKNEISISVFPNPSTDFVTIKSSEAINEIHVFNTLGSKILTTTERNIDVSNLSKGFYVLNITFDNGGKASKRLIKE